MIIKSLSIGNKSKYRIKQLVRYVLEDGVENQNPFERFLILNHINTLDTSKIHKAFLEQDKYRTKRKNGVCYFHEILSIHPKDVEHVTDEILEDLAKKYIEIRGANETIALVKPHFEKSHHHIHCIISATKYKSDESLRLDNENFWRVRIEMETYQKRKYPQLKHSLVYLDKDKKRRNKTESDRKKRTESEFQLKARLKGTPTKKEILNQRVSEILGQVKNPKEFLLALKSEPDFELYEYRGKITGIIFQNKKFRFKTIGIGKDKLKRLREQEDRMKTRTRY